MYRTTHQPTASRLAAASVTTALLVSLCSPFAALAAADAGLSTDHSKNVTTGEVAKALSDTSGILQSSASIASASDADSALQTDDGSVNISKDASSGVTLNSENGPSLDITLPNADQAGDGQQVAPGVVAYSSNNGSANAVQAEDDGSVRMLTVIDNKTAPRTYDYKITVPEGGSIELTPDGGAIGLDADGNTIAHVNAPWATDAKGKEVKTWFTADGTTLVQHIKHNTRGITYPITADPKVTFGWTGMTYHLNNHLTKAVASGGFGALGDVIGGPVGAVVSGFAGSLAADWAEEHHYCLAVWIPYGSMYVITYAEHCQ